MRDDGKKKKKRRGVERLYLCILGLIRSVVLNHQGGQHKTRGGSSGYLKTEEGGKGVHVPPVVLQMNTKGGLKSYSYHPEI